MTRFGIGKRCAGAGCSNFATDDSNYCEKCAEFKRQLFHEELGMIRCAHCSRLMTRGAFDKHGWSVYYREGYKPNGKRERKR